MIGLEKGIALKKQVLRINIYTTGFLIFLAIQCLAQQDPAIEKRWDKIQKNIAYDKNPNLKEPKDWWSNGPSTYNPENSTEESQKEYEDFSESILKSRKGKSGSKGDSDKKMKEPEMIDPPEFDPPDIDGPDVDVDPTKISKSTWQTVLFGLIFIAVIVGLYFWLRKQNANPKFVQEFDDDWNPEIITKSELVVRLENALLNENYREAVRVYFTLTLQELIALEFINWKREKTNHEYLRELKNSEAKSEFWQSVRIFELVWYGEYLLDKQRFEKIQPHFLSSIEKLKAIKR